LRRGELDGLGGLSKQRGGRAPALEECLAILEEVLSDACGMKSFERAYQLITEGQKQKKKGEQHSGVGEQEKSACCARDVEKKRSHKLLLHHPTSSPPFEKAKPNPLSLLVRFGGKGGSLLKRNLSRAVTGGITSLKIKEETGKKGGGGDRHCPWEKRHTLKVAID